MKWVGFGRFGRPHGIRGELRFWPFNPDSPLLRAGREVRVGPDDGECQPTESVQVVGLRVDGKGSVIQLDGIGDRAAARAYNGRIWYESRDDFEPIPDDEFYVVDLVGLTVRTEEGRVVGRVTAVMQDGPTDIYVVRQDAGDQSVAGQEVLIPAVERFIARVDLKQREIVARSIDDLLDVAAGR